MVKRLNIDINILNYYVQSSQIPSDYLESKVNDIDKILSGEKRPTFNQLSTIAKALNIPTGLLLLQKPIDTDNKRLEFRTLGSTKIDKMSNDLRDTITEIAIVQYAENIVA